MPCPFMCTCVRVFVGSQLPQKAYDVYQRKVRVSGVVCQRSTQSQDDNRSIDTQTHMIEQSDVEMMFRYTDDDTHFENVLKQYQNGEHTHTNAHGGEDVASSPFISAFLAKSSKVSTGVW